MELIHHTMELKQTKGGFWYTSFFVFICLFFFKLDPVVLCFSMLAIPTPQDHAISCQFYLTYKKLMH